MRIKFVKWGKYKPFNKKQYSKIGANENKSVNLQLLNNGNSLTIKNKV